MTVLEQANASAEVGQRRAVGRASRAGAVRDLLDRVERGDDEVLAMLPFVSAAGAPVVVDELLARAFAAGCGPARRTQLAALAAALSSGERAAVLIEQLAHDDEDVRATAATALAMRGNAIATRALIVAAADPSARVRAAAVLSLCDVGGPEACLSLASLLERWSEIGAQIDERVLRAALRGVVGAGRERAEPTLLAHLTHASAEVRMAALTALRELCSLAATAAVRGMLTDDDARVRLLALSVLERHGRPCDGAAVHGRLHDADARVRAMARDTVRALGAEARA